MGEYTDSDPHYYQRHGSSCVFVCRTCGRFFDTLTEHAEHFASEHVPPLPATPRPDPDPGSGA